MKLCALLNAIGSESIQVLLGQAIEVVGEDLTCDQVVKALKRNYKREKS